MKKLLSNKYLYFLCFSILFLILGILNEKKYYMDTFSEKQFQAFQATLIRKETHLDQLMRDQIGKLDSTFKTERVFSLYNDDWSEQEYQEGISLFLYFEKSLIYWTDNQIPVPSRLALFPQGKILSLGNSVYFSKRVEYEDLTLIGLIRIKTENPYENRFLQNGFQKDFNLPEQVLIVYSDDKETVGVKNKTGETLFYLDPHLASGNNPVHRAISLISYLLFLICFLVLIRRIVHKQKVLNRNLTLIFIMLLFLLFIKFVCYYRIPSIVFDLEFFSSVTRHGVYLLSSLGDLFMVFFVIFFVIYNFYVDFHMQFKRSKSQGILNFLLLVLFLILSLGLYVFDVIVFKILVVDSEISFETFKVLDLSVYTFVGFLLFAFLYVSYVLLTDKILRFYYRNGEKIYPVVFILIQVLIVFLLFLKQPVEYLYIETVLLAGVSSGLIWYYCYTKDSQYRFSNFILFVIIFSVFTLFQVSRFVEIKKESEMKRLAVNLSAEHDPIAEILFIDISDKIAEDEELENILLSPYFDFEYLYSTLQRKYFNGYWTKYDLQVTVCRPYDSVYVVPPDDNWYPCYSFFEEEILKEGVSVTGTDFFYLDNLNGRISYFYSRILNPGSDHEIRLFLELDSRLFAEGLGYPGLLLEDSYVEPSEDYAYGKYNKGRLITSKGDFSYSTNAEVYVNQEDGFAQFELDNYDHLAYFLDSDNIIIVSKPSVFWIDIIISFSYIFGFYFILLVCLLIISRISPFSIRFKPDFKNKIQLSITSIILVSFILMGAGTVYFSINQYRTRQLEILEEKVQSVYVELIHKLEYETDLKGWSSNSYYNLDQLLQKFSNVFYTDINLFQENGRLLATSRSEIYDMGLMSRTMNPEAYSELTIHKRSKYIHSERIGSLKYLSVYVPFVNAENKILAYLNLPYFTRQDELTREVANLVVAIINVVVLLSLLSFTIALFVSNTVTYPLRLIQQRIAGFSLNSKNEKIEYHSKDEIGALVKEYNEMVDQLKQSAELLAKSERESAWREMAKQIAHEIKNPLTPMKLSVQHLQRAYTDQSEISEDLVNRITHRLIEQINDLSAIATEFSNFAKMPAASNEVLDLARKLRRTLELFTDYERCIISLKIIPRDKVFIYADREQISRVFINLIKNAIQSIPESRTGKIEVILKQNGDKAVITITDNGKGIEENVRNKLFQPNFTTKSSGMGLGLSIVRNIVRNAGGDIYFKTVLGKGTTFFVELPLYKSHPDGTA